MSLPDIHVTVHEHTGQRAGPSLLVRYEQGHQDKATGMRTSVGTPSLLHAGAVTPLCYREWMLPGRTSQESVCSTLADMAHDKP